LRREARHEIARAPDERDADAKAISCAPNYCVETLSIVGSELRLLAGRRMTPRFIMTVVVPRIPLIVPSCVFAHPWSDRFCACMGERITQEILLACCVDQRRGAELHIVVPVVFFVEVRRSRWSSLAYSGMFLSKVIGSERAISQG